MKPKRPRSGSKTRSGQPAAGSAGAGKPFDPKTIAEERAPAGATRDAPAPGVPTSDADYDALKERAKTIRLPPSKHEQEDPSGKKRK
jgi:hypothetical protein